MAYYRPTTGPSNCRQEYDGQSDLLFNLDGKNMFYYGFLLHYLHLMLEGKNPLITFLRASKQSFSIQSMTKPVSIKLLRQAWNSFARLLDIKWSEAFLCPICGPSPGTIICDGTLLGFRKDLLDHIQPGPLQDPSSVCRGSRHRDRVILTSRKSRELLLKYSGDTKDRK